MPRSRPSSALLRAGLTAGLLLAPLQTRADTAAHPSDPLGGDYFVGAAVFLFERTVLIPFAPDGAEDGMLDAGAIVAAHENADSEDGAVALDAIIGWLAAIPTDAASAATPLPGFGPERIRALVCLVVGADPQDRAALARRAGLGEPDRAACTARFQEARKKWIAWLLPYRRTADTPSPLPASPEGAPSDDAPILRLAFAPAIDPGDQAIADAMRENGLFQVLTDDLNAAFAMPRPMTALLTQCGEPKAFYNPDRGEAVLCYELLGALLKSTPG